MIRPLRAYLHRAKSGNIHLRVQQFPESYSDDMRDRLHRVGTPANWDASRWEWDYPLTAAAVVTLQRVADESGCQIQWSDDLVQFATEQNKIEEYEKSVRLAMEKVLKDKPQLPGYITNTVNGTKPPLYHQQVAYHWGIRSSGLLLAHSPGLGKTRSAIDISRGWLDLGIVRPMQQFWGAAQGRWCVKGGILIVSPKQMLRTWSVELKLWQSMTGLEIAGHRRSVKMEKAGMIAHAHIVNYESLNVVLGNEYDAVIADESHRLSRHSLQTRNVLELVQRSKRRLALTGTPITNSLESAFYPMLILDGGRSLGASKTAFLERYFTSETVGPGITKNTPKENALVEVSAAMSRCTYFLKKEDAIALPPKLHTPIYLEMTPDQAKYYKSLKDEAITYIQDSTVTLDQAAARMMKLRQVCQGFVLDDGGHGKQFSGAKTEALMDMLQDKLAGRKTVVWGIFTSEIDSLCELLKKANIGYVRMDGTITSKRARDEALAYWNNDPRITVFIGQIQMGVGITLHANECVVPCYDCIYMGVDHSYVNWVQSSDRIHRLGQNFACNYSYLLTADGVDAKIYKSLLMKENTANAVYKTGKDFFLSLLRDDTPNLAALDAA